VRVGTRAELKAALDRAVQTRGRFQLIEVMIPRGVLSDTLSRFVAEVRRSRGQGQAANGPGVAAQPVRDNM
jgi:hypothetical protein